MKRVLIAGRVRRVDPPAGSDEGAIAHEAQVSVEYVGRREILTTTRVDAWPTFSVSDDRRAMNNRIRVIESALSQADRYVNGGPR